MQLLDRRLLSALALAAGVPLLGACSTAETLGSIKIVPNSLGRPDWLSYSGNKEEFTLRPTTAADQVGPDGQCAAAANEPAVEPGAPAAPPGGIALQMTECDVVRRAGTPERVEFGTTERGERAVAITYIRGARPGIYRFADGRLVSIERGPEPPAPAKKGATAKKRG